MKYRTKLFAHPQIDDIKGSNRTFFYAMKEMVEYHQLNNKEYEKILENENFSFNHLHTFNDLSKIPALPTVFLKNHPMFTISEKQTVVKATTSGTSGKKSIVGYDLNTGIFDLSMAIRTMWKGKFFSPIPTNYITLGYQPNKKNQTGISKSLFSFTLLTPTIHREYALKMENDRYKLDIEGLIDAIQRFSKQKLPVRLIGMPAFHYVFLTTLKERGIQLKLHPQSYLCLSGGWKQFYFEEADKSVLYDLSKEILGISSEHCRDFFGAVEHPIIYIDCPNRHFHIPIYSRVFIRDVATFEPIGYGKPGLLNLLTPLSKSMPLHSIVTDDLAILHRSRECDCGNPAPYFELLGRAGLQDIKTCAAGASQFLNMQF